MGKIFVTKNLSFSPDKVSPDKVPFLRFSNLLASIYINTEQEKMIKLINTLRCLKVPPPSIILEIFGTKYIDVKNASKIHYFHHDFVVRVAFHTQTLTFDLVLLP